MTKTNEAFWWSLFSAGGVMSALFIPAFILGTGFLLPFGRDTGEGVVAMVAYERAHDVVSFWLVRLVLLGVLCLTLVHCAHRIRHILLDLGFRGAPTALAVTCYGSAFAMAAVVIYAVCAL